MTRPDPYRIRLEDLVSDIRAPRVRAAASDARDRWALATEDIVDELTLSNADVAILERQLRLRCAEFASNGRVPVDATEFELLREELVACRAATFARGRHWGAHLDVTTEELERWLEWFRDVPR